MVYKVASITKIKISINGEAGRVFTKHANLAKKEKCKMSLIYT